MDLSIITVSWNVADRLKSNLKAIVKNVGGLSVEVFVVDNASSDGTAAMVKKEFSGVKLTENKENVGFARACNQALKHITGRYVLFLNPDMRVFPETLAGMVDWMDNHKEAALAGCRLIDGRGELLPHVRRFPTVWDQLAIIFKLPHIFPCVLNNYLSRDFNYNKEAEVDSIRGSFFMVRRETIGMLGGFDERYFIWFEEVDYCRRAREAGLRVMYTPVVKCVDLVGASFSQLPRDQTQKYFRDSMLKYFKKWQPARQYRVLKIAWPIGIFLTWAGGLINFKRRQ